MGTPQSRKAYLLACESGSIKAFRVKLFDLIRRYGPSSSMDITRILETNGEDIGKIRNVATSLSAMESLGILNVNLTRSSVDEGSGCESAVYSIPQQDVSEEEIIMRQLKRAEERRDGAVDKINKLYIQLRNLGSDAA